MRFLISLAYFPLALAFLCCHYLFDSYVTCLTLSFNTICVLSFILIFGEYIVLSIPYFSCIQIDFKDTHRKKHPNVKLQHFRKVWIWTFGSLVHQIDSVCEVSKLKQNFRKRNVVTGKTPFFNPHSICLNIGFWQSSFVRKCYVVNLSTFN